MPESQSRPLRVFLCHAKEDILAVSKLHRQLKNEGWIDPWLAEKNILPGQDWEFEIRRAIKSSDVVLVFLSHISIIKEGYLHKELRLAINVADEKPEGTIFLIPLKLDDCDVPESLKKKQWLDYFAVGSYERLLDSLQLRAKELGVNVSAFKEIIKPLSARETEVLSGVLRGMSNKEIASLLGISHQTVKNHVTSILRKLGVEDRTQAVVLALKYNLVD